MGDRLRGAEFVESNRSCRASVSAQTRVMIAPTVRHATRSCPPAPWSPIRISSVTALFEHWVANQATWASKAWGWPPACLAHPRHRPDRRTMRAAVHPRRVDREPDRDRAQVQRTPPAPSLTTVIGR